jgi:hypothetical protein
VLLFIVLLKLKAELNIRRLESLVKQRLLIRYSYPNIPIQEVLMLETVLSLAPKDCQRVIKLFFANAFRCLTFFPAPKPRSPRPSLPWAARLAHDRRAAAAAFPYRYRDWEAIQTEFRSSLSVLIPASR